MTDTLSSWPLYNLLLAVKKRGEGILGAYVSPTDLPRLIRDWVNERDNELVRAVLDGKTTLSKEYASLWFANTDIDANAGTTLEFDQMNWMVEESFENILSLDMVRNGASWDDLTRSLRSRTSRFFRNLFVAPAAFTAVFFVTLVVNALLNGTPEVIGLNMLLGCAAAGLFFGLVWTIVGWLARPSEVRSRKKLADQVGAIFQEMDESLQLARLT